MEGNPVVVTAARRSSVQRSSREKQTTQDQAIRADDLNEKHMEEHHRRETVQTASDSDAEYEQRDKGEAPLVLIKPRTHTLGILKLRARDDTDPTDWWFASTAIPLIAATFAPMANLLSIAALVVYWRNNVKTPDDPSTLYSKSVGYADPKWCTYLNAASLACGFIGNLFLLFNFTKRVRYIIALPLTIIFFYAASGILIAIIVCVDKYDPPRINQVYSQGYWHAVIAACLYMLNSMILMVNMSGYFLGHYPQNFNLNDEHRNLILQTMLFFIWLGGGAGVFARTQEWEYPDALYFCDVTILTIGFGDFYAQNDLGRGLVFPYSVGGTIILGLMVSSIHKFAGELSKEKVIRKHVETRRVNTLSRAVTIEELDDSRLKKMAFGRRLSIARPPEKDKDQIQQDLNEIAKQERLKRRVVNVQDTDKEGRTSNDAAAEAEPLSLQTSSPKQGNHSIVQKSLRTLAFPIVKPVMITTNGLRRVMTRNQKKILMLEERDRFNAMRSVQTNASAFKRYYALTLSVICFGMLWCLGAMVFYFAEAETQQLNYFQGLYFCYVSLLTIGYGDLSPRSNSGKAFFVVWSLIAVPTMTILISDLGDTVIGGFKRGVLKNDLGLTSKSSGRDSPSSWRSYLARLFRVGNETHSSEQTLQTGDQSQAESGVRKSTEDATDEDKLVMDQQPRTIDELANDDVSESEMLRRLAFAIRKTADEIKTQPGKQYSYEEWVEFSRLIKFSNLDRSKLRTGEGSAMKQLEHDEAEDGIVEWDWLDANSPMTSEQTEGEWVLDRLCESLLRVFRQSDFALGGLEHTKTGNEPMQSGVQSSAVQDGAFDQFPFDGDRNQHASSPQPPRRVSDDLPRSPDRMSKMNRFFHGESDDDETLHWSRRARAKRGQVQNTEERETRSSEDRRRSLPAVAPFHRRHGPFAQSNN